MFRNFFTTAFRSFLRNKSFSLINITGLAIGISASLVIFLIVKYDFSFDKFQADGDRIYRINGEFTFDGEVGRNSGAPIPMGNAIAKEVRGLDAVAFFQTWMGEKRVGIPTAGKDKPVIYKKEKKVVYADKNYFKIISYQWITGSPETALQQPYQVVLTESKAKLFFGDTPLSEIPGREIIFNDTIRTTVTGIVKDITENTDFTFNIFVSRATFEIISLTPDDWNAWDNVSSETQVFFKLSPLTSANDIAAQINAVYQKHRTPDPQDHSTTKYLLQPLSDLHFSQDYDNFDQRLAHKPTLYGLLVIAAFLLMLGCINFINLTTAQASQRAKEIGIRKTIGSSKKQLVLQFLSETFLLTLIATILSVIITPLLLKAFADFIPEGLHYNFLQPEILVFLFLLTVFISVLSGFYPALVLSSYKPVAVLKNQSAKDTGAGRNVRLRKVLSVSQFVIAQVFIIVTVLVSKQIRYSLNKELGFKKDAIVYFTPNSSRVSKTNTNVLVEKLKAIPEIQMVSLSYGPPSYRGGRNTTAKLKDGKEENTGMVSVKLGDPEYINLYKIKLLAGSNLTVSDTINGLLINETYLHALGFKNPADALGKVLKWNGDNLTPIVGVVGDFHEKSMHETIKPLVIAHWAGHEKLINIALRPQNAEDRTWQKAIEKIGLAWKEIYPDDDLEINFLDEQIAKYYEAEQHISSLLMWASGLSIFISCLGLLGLIIYITNQRTKEIGIRKVIGASVSQIISLLSKDFLQLVIIAFLIAVPIAWYSGNKWLENFAYRTQLSWWIFVAGGALMLFMALLILVIRTLKVATANPVHSLRTE
ncbi:MAG TPA: FtsX-like permease family protein [Bacteroidia bacterium]|nr:FtsX-like permease family protein [Bacteroidia bacterium]